MNTTQHNNSSSAIRGNSTKPMSAGLRAFSPIVLAAAIASLGSSTAQAGLLGLSANLGLGIGIGGGVTVAQTIMIDAQSPPVLLTGLGSSLVYRLIINGQASEVVQVQYANVVVIGGNYQWATLASLVLNGSGSATEDVSVPLGQAWVVRVEVHQNPPPPPPPPPPPGPSPDSARWAQISAGTFTMGSPETEYDRSDDESPQTQVTISHGFWIGRFEVTQGEFTAVVGPNPSAFSGDDEPVEQVSWNDATNYCALLTAQERSAGRLPDGYAYRLPTEAEWEFVTRAGTTTRFSFGDDHSYTDLANSDGTAHDVGGKQANPWGVYDTSGNVYEWCGDLYGPHPGGSVTDPTGAASGSSRVMRGGSWRKAGGDTRSAARNFNTPEVVSDGIGFRVVLAQTQP